MINELYELAKALENAHIQTYYWHREYIPIPKIKNDSPCVRVTISDRKVVDISQLDSEYDKTLRKYGSNQGSYPCMNLAPLYRIKDEAAKNELDDFKKHPERIGEDEIKKIKNLCTENNWGANFCAKYKNSMEDKPTELKPVAAQYEPLKILIDETDYFKDAPVLHGELERFVWQMIEDKKNVALALTLLFYVSKGNKDYGSISVAFESEKLVARGEPAVSGNFVYGLNDKLMLIGGQKNKEETESLTDAFGISFQNDDEPMPSVKLSGGIDKATIRTMFNEVPCQFRYGKSGNDSYPISQSMRAQLKAALEWIGGINADKRKDETWTRIDNGEILFVYPFALSENSTSGTAVFGGIGKDETTFLAKAKKFTYELKETKEVGTDPKSEQIRIFILKKADKARTKVIYTRQTDAGELEKCSEAWTSGCSNLPEFPFGTPRVPYPLKTADILNCFRNQNGDVITDKFKPFPKYHGIELLMEPDLPISPDLHRLTENAVTVSPCFANLHSKKELSSTEKIKKEKLESNVKDMLAMLGLLLYREHIGKEKYMENLPYLYGQLLKAADELHALYCEVVRNGDVPPQLAGSAMFQSASEMPARTMQMLSQRIMPYYSWAKSYMLKKDDAHEKERKKAEELYSTCEKIMNKLKNSWTAQTRFTDEEKAQLFIGYLASFPRKDNTDEQTEQNIEEETENE